MVFSSALAVLNSRGRKAVSQRRQPQAKMVSFAFLFERPRHVAHALN
jgi:hypothetical protein